MGTIGREARVWIDVLTSKQGTLLGTLAKELAGRGYEVLVTCRDYEYTCKVLETLGVPHVAVGGYVEGDPYSKVREDGRRVSALADVVRGFSPQYLVAYPDPSAARVAFGTGVRYVALTDSPHATIPSRLSLPLADFVVFSECIPVGEIEPYVSRRFTRLVTYRGVDEVGWIKRLEPREEDVRALGLRPWNYVVFRPAEEMATYYRGLSLTPARDVLRALAKLGYDVVLLPRYSTHRELGREGAIVLERGFVGPSLTYYARLVVTGGASIAREAALLGTPAITYTPLELHANSCVERWGYPLRRAGSLAEIEKLARELTEGPQRDRRPYLEKTRSMEDPLTVVERILGDGAAGTRSAGAESGPSGVGR